MAPVAVAGIAIKLALVEAGAGQYGEKVTGSQLKAVDGWRPAIGSGLRPAMRFGRITYLRLEAVRRGDSKARPTVRVGFLAVLCNHLETRAGYARRFR